MPTITRDSINVRGFENSFSTRARNDGRLTYSPRERRTWTCLDRISSLILLQFLELRTHMHDSPCPYYTRHIHHPETTVNRDPRSRVSPKSRAHARICDRRNAVIGAPHESWRSSKRKGFSAIGSRLFAQTFYNCKLGYELSRVTANGGKARQDWERKNVTPRVRVRFGFTQREISFSHFSSPFNLLYSATQLLSRLIHAGFSRPSCDPAN